MQSKKIQINFTGASGTGKTTLLNAVHEKYPDLIVGTEVVRTLIKTKGIKINEMGDEEGQKMIFGTYEEWIRDHKGDDYVSDRCVIDPVAYTMLHATKFQLPGSLLVDQWEKVKGLVEEGLLTTVFYFPIEFANVHDGVRSDNDEFRNDTDAAIRGLLDDLKRRYDESMFKVIDVRGTVDERMKFIDDYIQSL